MTDTTTQVPDTPRVSIIARVGWIVLIVATLYVCYFSHLGAIGFVGPDEPRYAWVARDMVETGDWVTPRLYGKPWFEKPPLFYWGAALCFKLFGVSEAAARLPSAISALLATLALAWLAWRVYGPDTGRWLLLLLPTSVGMIGFSHAAATDMPFSGMLTIAMVAAAVVIGLVSQGGTPASSSSSYTPSTFFASLLFGFFLGLAVLAKGPAAIILCGGAIFFWALSTKRWRDAFRLFHPAAIVAFCLTALPWYILCARRNPDFFRVFIIEHNFKRYLTPEFQHIQPFWFYIPILLLASLPWTALLLWSASLSAVRLWREKQLSGSMAYFLSWALFTLVFFSISKSKLPGYILPSAPAICLLIARSFAAIAPTRRESFRLVHLVTALAFAILLAITEVVTPSFSRGNEKFGIAAGLIIASVGAANLILGCVYPLTNGTPLRTLAPASSIIAILVVLFFADKLLHSFFRWDPSGRSLTHELHLRGIPADQLQLANMHRGLHYSLNFYLGQEISDWNRSPITGGYILTGVQNCKHLVAPGFICKEIPIDLQSTGMFLYRVTSDGSADRQPGGGKAQ